MELSDGSRVCRDCEAVFIIEEGARRFFEAHGLTLPKRCKACRQIRKALAHQAELERAAAVLGE